MSWRIPATLNAALTTTFKVPSVFFRLYSEARFELWASRPRHFCRRKCTSCCHTNSRLAVCVEKQRNITANGLQLGQNWSVSGWFFRLASFRSCNFSLLRKSDGIVLKLKPSEAWHPPDSQGQCTLLSGSVAVTATTSKLRKRKETNLNSLVLTNNCIRGLSTTNKITPSWRSSRWTSAAPDLKSSLLATENHHCCSLLALRAKKQKLYPVKAVTTSASTLISLATVIIYKFKVPFVGSFFPRQLAAAPSVTAKLYRSVRLFPRWTRTSCWLNVINCDPWVSRIPRCVHIRLTVL